MCACWKIGFFFLFYDLLPHLMRLPWIYRVFFTGFSGAWHQASAGRFRVPRLHIREFIYFFLFPPTASIDAAAAVSCRPGNGRLLPFFLELKKKKKKTKTGKRKIRRPMVHAEGFFFLKKRNPRFFLFTFHSLQSVVRQKNGKRKERNVSCVCVCVCV